jgi:hypothetical protein
MSNEPKELVDFMSVVDGEDAVRRADRIREAIARARHEAALEGKTVAVVGDSTLPTPCGWLDEIKPLPVEDVEKVLSVLGLYQSPDEVRKIGMARRAIVALHEQVDSLKAKLVESDAKILAMKEGIFDVLRKG